MKEQLTQAQLLNQEAKLLARFVSTINKCIHASIEGHQ
jgi:hypothetical protein